MPERPPFALWVITGWPKPALQGAAVLTPPKQRLVAPAVSPVERALDCIPVAGSLPGRNLARSPRLLPLRPVWPGFVIDTLLYAVTVLALTALIRGPWTLRRLIRERRGLCAKCGYDLRHAAHEACPECGAAIARRASVPATPPGGAGG